jgi:hypothetical protein
MNFCFVFIRLLELESGLLNGEVTVDGYCKQKWEILEPHVPFSMTKQIQSLQNQLESTKLSEVGIIASSIFWGEIVSDLCLIV